MAHLTTINPSHPHATEDRTELYLAKLVKDFVKDYKGNRNWTCRSQHFSEIVLTKGLYYGHKDKGYAMEVVTTAEKLPPDGFEGRLGRSMESARQQSRD